MYATQTRPVTQTVAEFQLIEDKNGFILGRLFIPAGVHGCVPIWLAIESEQLDC